MASATDRITVNAGGRLFETTTTTLKSSGAHFFQALLGETGEALAGRGGSNAGCIFVDRDPDLFDEVLYFMRCDKLREATKLSATRLEDLKAEALFFAFDSLMEACSQTLEDVQKALKDSMPSAEAASFILTQEDDIHRINVGNGKILFVVSATLAGACSVARYKNFIYPEALRETRATVPGCYLKTYAQQDSGDFQLHAKFGRVDDYVCIAHVGLDHIHVGQQPLNFDFRQDIRLCLSPDETGWVEFSVDGSGSWHVVYWVGDAEAIPQLKERPSSKHRVMQAVIEE